jgi:hypothetical protein
MRGKVGMGALGSRTQHRASLPLDAPHPTSPRCAGGGASRADARWWMPHPTSPRCAGGGVPAIRSRARAHQAPSPVYGGRLGWASKSRVSPQNPFPRLRGKAGMGALGSRIRHRASLPPDAPLPTSPRCAGGGASCADARWWMPLPTSPRCAGGGVPAIRSRARAHQAPSPVYGGRLGWGHSAVAPNTVLRYRPTPPTQPPPAAQGEERQPSEAARERTKPLPPFTGEGWDGRRSRA